MSSDPLPGLHELWKTSKIGVNTTYYINLKMFVHSEILVCTQIQVKSLLNLFNQSAFPFGKALFHHQNQSAAIQGSQVRVKQVLTWGYPHQAQVITLGQLWGEKENMEILDKLFVEDINLLIQETGFDWTLFSDV